MRLMGSVPVGRIVYTRQALPAVELVNFALADGDIVIRTDAGGKLAAATRGAVVAFEADSVDTGEHAGWSVTVVGQSRAVTDAEEIHERRLARLAIAAGILDERRQVGSDVEDVVDDLEREAERATVRGQPLHRRRVGATHARARAHRHQ